MRRTTSLFVRKRMSYPDRPGTIRRRLGVEQLEVRHLLTVGLPELVSVNEAGTAAANGASTHVEEALSADGRYYVFMSNSCDVVSGDMNGTTDVFVRDLQTGATTLVSRTASGGTANSCSDAAVMSADGRFVAFQSTATDLDGTATSSASGWRQVYRWDRYTGEIRLVSANHTGTDGGNHHSSNPTISEDGQRVAFETWATDLSAGITDANGVTDVYLRDLSNDSPMMVLVSHVDSDARTTGDFASQAPRISRNGSRVVYLSRATNLDDGVSDINGVCMDVVVYCVSDNRNQYVSVETQDATSGNGESTRTSHSLSADGRFEVFTSRSSDLMPGDLNGMPDVFLCDLLTGTMTLISHTASGPAASGLSGSAAISADGNFVVFESSAPDLDVTGPISSFGGIYRWARETGEIVLVSLKAAGTDGVNRLSQHASISADGQRIAFDSLATDLVAGVTDTNNNSDVYLRDFSGAHPTTVLVSHAAGSVATTGNGGSSLPQVSRDGGRIVYASAATDIELGATDLNSQGTDVIVFDVSGGANQYVSVETHGATSGNDGSYRTSHSLSADGRYEVFTSSASDLVSGDLNATADVFLRDLATGVTTLISHTADGGSPNDRSSAPVISADGTFVAFESFATDMAVTGARISGYANRLYRWNRLTDEILLVSSNASSGYNGYDGSYEPSISADGQRIAFQVGLWWSGGDVYLRDFTGSSPTTVLVSHAAGDPATPGNGMGEMAQIAGDGTTVVFLSTATNLVSGVVDGNGPGEDLFAYDVASGEIVAVNIVPGGAATGNAGVDPKFDISRDGQIITFASDASNLTPSDNDDCFDVFVRNLSIPAVELVSVDSSGQGKGQQQSWSPSISSDGRYVAFESRARLTSQDVNWCSDIYVRDRNPAWPTTTLISVNSSGTAAGDWDSYEPWLSDDGMTVGFCGYARDLDGTITDANEKPDVFLRNWKAGAPTTRLVSRAGEGNASGDQSSSQVELSGDGSRLVFTSQATNLTSAISDVNGYATDVFAYDGSSMALASQKGHGTFTCTRGASDAFDLSDTGQYVAFSADAVGLVSGNGSWNEQVYVRDVVVGANELVSVNNLGIMGNSSCHMPSVSGDGRYVAFQSFARNLSPLDTSAWSYDIYVRDRDPGHPTTTLISVNSLGTSAGNYDSVEPYISHDGATVVFRSGASDLDGAIADINGTYDVFVRNWQTPPTRLVSRSSGGTTSGDSFSSQVEVSDDGHRVIFTSMAWDLEAGVADVNGWNRSDVFAFDGSRVRFVSRKGAGSFTGSSEVWGFDLSDTGQFVAFSTTAVGTVADAVGGVFVRDVVAGMNERASVDNAGVAGGGESPSISGDGRYVAFVGSNLDPLSGYGRNIYVRDRNPSSPTTTLVSINDLGTTSGDADSFLPRISHDGSTVAFYSYASNLDGTVIDTNGQPDVFLRKWRAVNPVTDLVSRHCDGLTSGNGVSGTPTISDNGITIAFASYALDLTPLPDGNDVADVFAVKATAISITPLDVAKSEGNSGTTGFTFLVSRRWFTENAVAIDWTVTGTGAAPADAADFGGTFPSGSVNFMAGETEKTIMVNVTGDLIAEANEGFTVRLSDSSSNSQIVTPTASGTIQDDDTATVIGRKLFYNHSAWDGNSAAATAADDNAIAIDKAALLPGQTAAFANYTSNDKGINGLMIDVRGLDGTPTADDFLFRRGNNNKPYGNDLNNPSDDWPWAPGPITIAVRHGAGVDGADRVTLIWEDGVIRNCWLQVTLLATNATGLARDDVFYVGNAVGESGNSATDALVNATDEIGARNNPHSPFTPAPKSDAYDYNRDKLVNATDQIVARNNRTSPFTALKLIAPPLEGGGSGDGEGERYVTPRTEWIDGGSLRSDWSLPHLFAWESLVVSSVTCNDLPRPLVSAGAVRSTSSSVIAQQVPEHSQDLLAQNVVDGVFTRLAVQRGTIVSDRGDAWNPPTATRNGEINLLSALVVGPLVLDHFTDTWQVRYKVADPLPAYDKSEDVHEKQLPVGPVEDETIRDPSRHVTGSLNAHGRNAHRTLDEALQEFLAEWNQL